MVSLNTDIQTTLYAIRNHTYNKRTTTDRLFVLNSICRLLYWNNVWGVGFPGDGRISGMVISLRNSQIEKISQNYELYRNQIRSEFLASHNIGMCSSMFELNNISFHQNNLYKLQNNLKMFHIKFGVKRWKSGLNGFCFRFALDLSL